MIANYIVSEDEWEEEWKRLITSSQLEQVSHFTLTGEQTFARPCLVKYHCMIHPEAVVSEVLFDDRFGWVTLNAPLCLLMIKG